MIKILVVEDDKNLNESVYRYLSGCGYEVSSVFNAADALKKLEERKFDIILSDIMMPGTDGFELAKSIRRTDEATPILFMTARDDITSKERGFSIGIDDYLVKPFHLEELKLRIGALLRRAKIAEVKKIELGGFIMNEEEHTARLGGVEIPLTVKEFSLLYKLLSSPKKTFSRSVLMDEFWGFDSSSTSRAVDVCIAELRKKVSACTQFEIVTVHGLGYKAVIK